MSPPDRAPPRPPVPALLALVAATLLGACATRPATGVPAAALPPATSVPADARTVVLVSLDAFRAADVGRGVAPTLSRLAREGVHAEWMNPSYPSLTFPNHYTMVTGLRPDRHGMVHNTMWAAELGRFDTKNRAAVGDTRWWQGEPIWVRAERAGLPTATLFWPGTEAPVLGVQPRRWTPFDQSLPLTERVDTVLAWLAEPPATRPRLATLYFETIDVASHAHGPDSPQAAAARQAVDDALRRLVDGLAARGQLDAVDLVIVSDHGMASVPPGQWVALEDLVPASDAVAITNGQSVGFNPRRGREAAAEAALLGRHAHHACWRKAELPARWHYGTHPRIPAIVCQADEGWDLLPRATIATRPTNHARGSHGYDPALPSMRAIFVARGPSFRRGVTLPAFDNVDVAPLLGHLLGLPPVEGDGTLVSLRAALVETDEVRATE